MGDVKNIMAQEAIEKLKSLVEDVEVGLFVTRPSQQPLNARPMYTMDVDNQGNLWFFSGRTSDKNSDIKQDSHVQLFYSNPKSSEFLSVYGRAIVIDDQQKKNKSYGNL